MPRQSPVPEGFDAPFYDACNDERLLIQFCSRDDRWQYPPERTCRTCGSANHLEWREVSGAGSIYSYAVVYDTPITSLQNEQPFNCAVVALDEPAGILFMSHLPGVPVDEVPLDAPVALHFVATSGTGQKVPEWHTV